MSSNAHSVISTNTQEDEMFEAGYLFTATPEHEKNGDREIQIIADTRASVHDLKKKKLSK